MTTSPDRNAGGEGRVEKSTRIGVDVGGTFTDFVMVDEARGQIFTGKRLTTSGDPSIAIIDGGRIKALGSPTELKVGLGGDLVSLTIHEHDRVAGLEAAVKNLPAIRAVAVKPNGLDIRVDSPEKALPAILEAANRLACRLEFIDYHRPRLDDVFIAHTGRSIKDETPKEEER